jgi:AAHS family 4-hydroxybenzoate transporter-like MFS transporter
MSPYAPSGLASERPSGQASAVRRGIRPYAVVILVLAILIGMTEGFDITAMSLAAPIIAKLWKLSPSYVGALLSMSTLGVVVGNFLLSPLGDRWGRRPSILVALTITGIGTVAGALAPDYAALLAARLVAGLGLGWALPNVLTIVAEQMPRPVKALAILLVCSSYSLGMGVGGFIVGYLIPHDGYAVIFVFGGTVTLATMLLCCAFLPESVAVLARRPAAAGQFERLKARLGLTETDTGSLAAVDGPLGLRAALSVLFAREHRVSTTLLWVVCFANMALVYFCVSWIPSLLTARGLDPQTAIRAASAFTGSGLIGSLSVAYFLPRCGVVFTLGTAYLVALLVVVLLAFGSIGDHWLVFAALAMLGAAVVGSQSCLFVVSIMYYPSDVRATASGYANGVGRIGAILAPLGGGFVIAHLGDPRHGFAIAIVPALVALIAVALMRVHAAFGEVGER